MKYALNLSDLLDLSAHRVGYGAAALADDLTLCCCCSCSCDGGGGGGPWQIV